jgi:hypothetical protein
MHESENDEEDEDASGDDLLAVGSDQDDQDEGLLEVRTVVVGFWTRLLLETSFAVRA